MNSMQVKDKLKNIARSKKIDFNIALKFYVFDRFIVRLSKSEYKDNFIIKGGFLLSTMFGLENRSTMDIDYAITKTKFTRENILKMIKSIIRIDLKDNIKFSIKDIDLIREEDKYGGYRINLLFQFENIKESLKIDIATGDPITPKEIEFNYESMLTDECLNVWSYNLETVLAEKIETIFSRTELSSRMKDYYDIFLIYSRYWNQINKDDLISAMQRTFKKRNFSNNLIDTLFIIKRSSIIQRRWEAYSKKYDYAHNIEYEQIMECLENVIGIMYVVYS